MGAGQGALLCSDPLRVTGNSLLPFKKQASLLFQCKSDILTYLVLIYLPRNVLTFEECTLHRMDDKNEKTSSKIISDWVIRDSSRS